MEQYIPKSALLAEIEKRIRACGNCYVLDELTSLHRTFNSLEVKEVDLYFDEELEKYIENDGAFIKDNWVVEKNNGNSYNHIYDLRGIAEHFFELGLKAKGG